MIEFAGTGLYGLPEAGRLLNEEPRTVRRWAFGYTRRGVHYESPIKTEIPVENGFRLVTFLELIELMFIQGFLRAGISWSKVRKASLTAARLLRGERHPFAMKKWFVDPAGIYLKLAREYGENVLVEVVGDAQVAIGEALEPYLQQIDFDVSGLAQKWYPHGITSPVVVDPRRAWGAPIIDAGGVRTDLIAEMSRAGDSVRTIAAWYEVDEFEVASALNFEGVLVA